MMKTVLFLLMANFIHASSSSAFASEQVFLINVDKGSVHVSFEDMKEPFRIRSESTKLCDGDLLIHSLPGMLTLRHNDKHCVSGRSIWLTLPKDQSVRFKIQAGVIVVSQSKRLKKNFGFIEAAVHAGVLQSEVDFISVNTVPGSGSASYISPMKDNHKLIMTLDAGVLNFER